jgi:hypothetical protein
MDPLARQEILAGFHFRGFSSLRGVPVPDLEMMRHANPFPADRETPERSGFLLCSACGKAAANEVCLAGALFRLYQNAFAFKLEKH